MATRIAIAQQKEAALARIAAATATINAEPPPAQGKQDADAYTATLLDWAAGTLEAIVAQQPTPKGKRATKEAEE